MAPEQFRGDGSDARTDIFNFCAALWTSLFGEPPFSGNTFVERRAAVLAGRRKPVPSGHQVPRWLRALLTHGMAHDPDARLQTMEAVIEALQYEVRARRRRVVAVAAAVALVAVAGSAVVSLQRSPLAACRRSAHQLDRDWTPLVKKRVSAAFTASGLSYQGETFRTVESFLDRYVQSFTAAYADACDAAHSDGKQSFDARDLRLGCLEERAASFAQLGRSLASADGAVVTEAASGAAKLEPIASCSDLTSLGAPQPPPRDPPTRAKLLELRRRLATAHGLELAGKFDDARAIADQVLAATHALGYAPLEARAWFRLGALDRDRGRWGDAERGYTNAVDAAERGRDDALRGRAMIELVEVVGHRQSRLAEGGRWAHQAEMVLARVAWPPRDVAALAMSRGLLRLREARLDEAERDLRESLRLRQEMLSPNDPLLGMTLADLAIIVDSAGRYADADALYHRAYDQLAGALGADHPRTTAVLGGIAGVSYELGRFHQSRDEYERALAGQVRARAAPPERRQPLGQYRQRLRLPRRPRARGQLRRACALDHERDRARHGRGGADGAQPRHLLARPRPLRARPRGADLDAGAATPAVRTDARAGRRGRVPHRRASRPAAPLRRGAAARQARARAASAAASAPNIHFTPTRSTSWAPSTASSVAPPPPSASIIARWPSAMPRGAGRRGRRR